jgi:N6-adenosine-specific RNA methylase IME4
VAEITPSLSRKEWAEKITQRYQDSVRAILDVGRYLIQAKAELEHGEFGVMIANDLPFSRPTAFRFMAIAQNPVLSSDTHAQRLPTSWGTLYELSKVPTTVLEEALTIGQITPDFQRKDVPSLIPVTPRRMTKSETATVTDLTGLTRTGKTFGSLYVIPPWPVGLPFQESFVEELTALPIPSLAAEDAHLHLWTTNAYLFACESLFRAWGFIYKSVLVWIKPTSGEGDYWQGAHEFLLLGVRGALSFLDHNHLSWFEAELSTDGTKPKEVRTMIERVSPAPYLELFGKEEIQDWTVWKPTAS